jgi:hypothetical protein
MGALGTKHWFRCRNCGMEVTVDVMEDLCLEVSEPEQEKSRKEKILDTIGDSVSDLLYYDRKEDEELPLGAIQEAIREQEITLDEMVAHFKEELTNGVKGQT